MERSSPGSPALGSGSFSSEFGRFSSPSLHLKSDLCIMSFPVQSHNNVRCHVFSAHFYEVDLVHLVVHLAFP